MTAFPWGAAISAAGSVLGGLLGGGGDSAKDAARANYNYQTRYDLNRPEILVKGAQRAGIHPLIVMGANPAMGTWAQPVAGQPSLGDAIGSGLQAAAAGVSEYQANKAQEKRDAENAQLEHFNMLRQASLDADNRALTKAQINAYNAQAMADVARSRTILANSRSRVVGGSGVTNPMTLPDGSGWKPGPSATAQTMQDQYGDIVENGYGLWRLLMDSMSNAETFRGLPNSLSDFIFGPSGPPRRKPGQRPPGKEGWMFQ